VKLRLPTPWFVVLPLLLLALWHFAVTLRWVTEGIIPSPEQVLRSWHIWIFGSSKAMLSPYAGTWLDNVAYSSRRVLQGFALAAAVAIPLGLMIGWSRLAARLVDPTVQLLRPVPITAWLPFAIAVFGIYDASALFLIGLGALSFPKIPSGLDSHVGTESAHHEKRCLRSSTHLGCSSPTCSSREAGLKPRICFSVIS
jgi:NitT/TauT family transport system permease protein